MSVLADRIHMSRALALARKGRGTTHPNPMVGAVVVRGGRVVGEGWHRRPGEPHAEALALAAAGGKAKGGTLYVNLEPCCHHGRTPPCTDAILGAGVSRVVASCLDPNPVVNGRGFRTLRGGGVRVEVGLLEGRARDLNRAFFHMAARGEPYVVLKLASTLDGRIAAASGESRWITGDAARRRAHRLRAECDAVLVGAGTVAADDPLLTVRPGRNARQPDAIVIDPSLRISPSARLLGVRGRRSIVVTSREAAPSRRQALLRSGAVLLQLPLTDGVISWSDLAPELVRIGIVSLLVEGGGRTAAQFLRQGAVARIELFLAPRFLGAEGVASVGDLGAATLAGAPGFTILGVRRVGSDIQVTARKA